VLFGLDECFHGAPEQGLWFHRSQRIDEREAGLASGLSNTTFQIGAAIGTAIVSTVAVSRTDAFLAENGNGEPLLALTEGFQSGFMACIVLAGIALVCALLLLGRAPQVPSIERLEAIPEPAGD
jgi:MFS family permease